MKKNKGIILVIAFFIGLLWFFNQNGGIKKDLHTHTNTIQSEMEYVNANDFGAIGDDSKDDSDSIQEAIDYSHDSSIGKVKLLGNKSYILKKGLVLKGGVELELGQNTRLMIDGNFKVIEIEKNASIKNGIIEIPDKKFNSSVIFLNGKQKIWSWDRTRIQNVSIINSSGSHKGTGLYLFADGPGHFISFMNVSDLYIVGFHTGVKLEALAPQDNDSYSFINGNRFTNLTLDDCVRCIDINSSVTIPNESSGNEFSGLQIQVSKATEKVLTVSGSDNRFEGIVWDIHTLKRGNDVIEFTRDSTRNILNSNIESQYILDHGRDNNFSFPKELVQP